MKLEGLDGLDGLERMGTIYTRQVTPQEMVDTVDVTPAGEVVKKTEAGAPPVYHVAYVAESQGKKIPTWVWIAGAGVLALLLLRRGGGEAYYRRRR